MNCRPVLDIVVPAALVGGAFVILSFVACSSTPAPAQTEGQKHVAADAAYTADLLVCVDKAKYPTRLESDFCVTTTKKRWGRP